MKTKRLLPDDPKPGSDGAAEAPAADARPAAKTSPRRGARKPSRSLPVGRKRAGAVRAVAAPARGYVATRTAYIGDRHFRAGAPIENLTEAELEAALERGDIRKGR